MAWKGQTRASSSFLQLLFFLSIFCSLERFCTSKNGKQLSERQHQTIQQAGAERPQQTYERGKETKERNGVRSALKRTKRGPVRRKCET
jgi:hypothetical protein